MALPIGGEGAAVAARVEGAIRSALPDAAVAVRAAGPGHFEIEVVAEAFRGQPKLHQHQLVYAAIAPLMAGDAAPVHAVDRLVTRPPA
jgi:stress-induced morphogen